MKVGIVAGEKSGDYLGAELIRAIKLRHPQAEFIGLAGPLMQQAGAQTLAEMDKISIMGIVGVLKGLMDILKIRRTIREFMIEWRPDVFIGIDVPDFNLNLEAKLKQSGIPTVHYVSPTVWAWRSKRIVKIKKAINLMLTLFPFEEAFYHRHETRVKYVGHPLAKPVIDWQSPDKFLKQHEQLLAPANNSNSVSSDSVSDSKKLIAVLPGSRSSEVSRLAPIMLEAAILLKRKFPNLQFAIPAATDKLHASISQMAKEMSAPVTIINGHSRDILAHCHLAILASGTAALEAALFAKPMVVMYKVARLEEWYASRTMVVKHFSMPNHLTHPPVVPELIQEQATVDNLLVEVERLLTESGAYHRQQSALSKIAPQLAEDSGALACDAIESLLRDMGRL